MIDEAVNLLRQGKLVAFPTETVYGLGADAANPAAIARIFAVKKRPADHPLIIHIANINELEHWAQNISPLAFKLAEKFWPGPLTLILKKQLHVLDLVTACQPTVGLRIPRHPIAQALLKNFGRGIAAPSANLFTHISPTTAQAVQEELGDQIDLILEGGACEVGLESTIIDLSQGEPVILRPGMITKSAIAETLGVTVKIAGEMPAIRTPGNHFLHYAPATATRVMNALQLDNFFHQLESNHPPFALIAHSQAYSVRATRDRLIILSDQANQYAHDLYQTLRSLDTGEYQQIIIEAVPLGEEWTAIRDRLFKASGSL